jgi:hypothetical protein
MVGLQFCLQLRFSNDYIGSQCSARQLGVALAVCAAMACGLQVSLLLQQRWQYLLTGLV